MNKLRIWLAYYILPQNVRKYLIKALTDATNELVKELTELYGKVRNR